ncbi:MAG: L-threonylcarbamoyladenylate synthase [Balneolales bacterium]
MAQKVKLHHQTPHKKRIFELADLLKSGSVALFPTDSQYALGCCYDNKKGVDRIRLIRHLPKDHLFTLICDSLSGISKFAQLSDENFKVIKRLIPGPYTFVLPSTKEVPKLLVHPRRETIGFRVPDAPICQELIAELGIPLIAATAKTPEMNENGLEGLSKEQLFRNLEKQVDIVVDDDLPLQSNQSTIINMTGEMPVIVRRGLGIEALEEAFAWENVGPLSEE